MVAATVPTAVIDGNVIKMVMTTSAATVVTTTATVTTTVTVTARVTAAVTITTIK